MPENTMSGAARTSRRTFLGVSALTAASYQRVLGANDRVQLGVIGCGNIARTHLTQLRDQPDADPIAMCDAYVPRAHDYVKRFNPRATAYQDFRKVLDNKDVQAVWVTTPPHWHALMTMMACAAGKDVYVEKPMMNFVREGRWTVEVARRYNRVVQVGTQQHSGTHYKKAATDLIPTGYLGKVMSIRSGFVRNDMPGFGYPEDSAVPDGLDWDLFLGPSPRHPYNANRGMNDFTKHTARWFWDTAGGQQCNYGTHEMDIVLWALGVKGPLSVASFGGRFVLQDNCEVPDTQDSLFEFPGGVTAIFSYREASVGGRPIPVLWFYGTKGGMDISRAGMKVYPDEKEPEIEPMEMPASTKAVGGIDVHQRNFLDCVKSRQRPNADVELGHYATASCHLANISLRLGGRKLRWDAEKEDFIDDREASAMLVRPYSPPWDRELRSLGFSA